MRRSIWTRHDGPRASRAVALVGVAAVILAACSSSTSRSTAPTVSPASVSPSARAPADASPTQGSRPSEPNDEETADAVGPGDPGTSDGDTSTTGSAPTTDPSEPERPGTPSPTEPAAEPDTATIRVGVVIPGGDPGRAVGAEGFGTDEERVEKEVRAVVDHINRNGGYGGHPVEMIFGAVDQTDQSSSNQERLQAEMCERMTQDEQVHLVIALGLGTVRAQDCYAEHRTPLFELTNPASPSARPWVVPNTWVGPVRMAELMPHAYAQLGFLTDAMGVVTFDSDPERTVTDTVLVPGLEERGGTVLETAYISRSSYGDIAAGISSAVLRFKSAGIDRVVFFAKGGGVWLLFTRSAEGQDYNPRYGISTWDFPQAIGPLISEEQHVGTVGPGYLPLVDQYLEALPEPDARQRFCWEIINEATGSNYQDFSASEAVSALGICEGLFIGKSALDLAPGDPIDRERITRLYRRIGGQYEPFAFDRLHFNDQAPDAVTVWSPIGYDQEGCACFLYTGAPRPIP